ncbi:MAG: alpha/beta fold hydrolase [Pseudomonadota bacterium]
MRKLTRTEIELPLTPPVTTQAIHAPSDGEWRLFIFHGAPGNDYLFSRFLHTAPPDLDVVLAKRPGYERGARGAITDFDHQVAAIKPWLGDKKVIVLGVSYGGALALKAALDFPDHIFGVATVAALVENPRGYILAMERFSHQGWIETLAPNRWHRVRDEIENRRTQIGGVLERLPSLKAPVEIIHGNADHLVALRDAKTLLRAFGAKPNVRLDIAPGGTHYLELQFPRRLHRAVERLIAENAP